MTSDGKITAFLMDDHEVVRQGVRALLESSGEIEVVGEASNATEALQRIPAVRPQVAVLDVVDKAADDRVLGDVPVIAESCDLFADVGGQVGHRAALLRFSSMATKRVSGMVMAR